MNTDDRVDATDPAVLEQEIERIARRSPGLVVYVDKMPDGEYAERVPRPLPPPGRSPQQIQRIEAMVAAAAELGPQATRRMVADYLGQVGAWGDLNGQFRRDIRDAGGWAAIKEEAAARLGDP